MRISKLPTIIGLVVLIFGLALGVIVIKNQEIFRLGASPQTQPKDVRISNITDTSFSVSWITDKKTSGFVKWGTNANDLANIDLDEIGDIGFSHYVTIRTRQDNQNKQVIYFKINSDGNNFDNNNLPWQINLAPTISPKGSTEIISGTVISSAGNPEANALVYATVAGGNLLSSYTSNSGSWVIPLGLARTQNLDNYLSINEVSTLIELSVNTGASGVSSAQIYPIAAKPAPPMIIGQIHDFTSLRESSANNTPNARLELPDNSSSNSRFNLENSPTSTPSSKTVSLDSIQSGETINTTNPEFFGTGPADTQIQITIHSNSELTGSVKVNAKGNWTWDPPNKLSVGSHTLTISWKDAAGILRSLTRTFVVQAAEGPAFEATPSATPKLTATPKTTATATPKASLTPKPSPTLKASVSPSPAAIPVSGNLTPTILLFMMGIGTLVASVFAFKKSDI